MKYSPHDYQAYATEFILSHPVAAILLQMGLGKSVITLTAIRELLDRGEVKKVLVIAPAAGCPRYLAGGNSEVGSSLGDQLVCGGRIAGGAPGRAHDRKSEHDDQPGERALADRAVRSPVLLGYGRD